MTFSGYYRALARLHCRVEFGGVVRFDPAVDACRSTILPGGVRTPRSRRPNSVRRRRNGDPFRSTRTRRWSVTGVTERRSCTPPTPVPTSVPITFVSPSRNGSAGGFDATIWSPRRDARRSADVGYRPLGRERQRRTHANPPRHVRRRSSHRTRRTDDPRGDRRLSRQEPRGLRRTHGRPRDSPRGRQLRGGVRDSDGRRRRRRSRKYGCLRLLRGVQT